jgi:hypothetical protein
VSHHRVSVNSAEELSRGLLGCQHRVQQVHELGMAKSVGWKPDRGELLAQVLRPGRQLAARGVERRFLSGYVPSTEK